MISRAVYLVFLLSGISGLLYQVIWVRWFGMIFGNTVYSASLVVAVFMCGLGAGSYLVGIWADRHGTGRPVRALRAYAGCEIAIAVLGAAIALGLPLLARLSATISSYEPGPHGWQTLSTSSTVLRLAVAVLVLAPITTLMGGTLTLLVRHLLASDVRLAGWRIGLLYGFNTGGAALGALLSDFALIPRFGLFATQMIAVALNLLAGLAALRLARGLPPDDATAAAVAASAIDDPTELVGDRAGMSPIVFYTALAILLSGVAAMGIEILWFRQFSIVLGSRRAVFSLLLTVILVGIWLGAIAGGLLHRRLGRPALLYMLAQLAFVGLTIALLGLVDLDRGVLAPPADAGEAGSLAHAVARTAGILQMIAVHVGPPAFLMGLAYPLANANIQDAVGQAGRRAGFLYVANSIGAVIGALGTGFWLIPWLGFKDSLTVLAVVGALSIVALAAALAAATSRRRALVAGVLCLAPLAVAITLWSQVPATRFQLIGIRAGERVLALSEGESELIAVTEGPGGRRLNTNGHSMSGTEIEAQRYMRAFAHIPLLHLDRPRDALVICFGVGTTLHAASLHPSLERIELADLSQNVVSQAHHFAATNHDVRDDPRVHVYINDGRQHLRMRPPRSFDLITLEPPPIGFAGVSSLYSRDFYQLARSRLKEGGFMSQWLPAYQLQPDAVLAMVRAFIDVFPDAILLSGERGELILLGRAAPGPITIDPVALARRLAERPAVLADLRRVHLGTLTEILGTFFSSSRAMREATAEVEPITDDHAIMEYGGPPARCGRTRFPEALVDPAGFPSWCPTCLQAGAIDPALATLGDYLHVLEGYYHSPDFLHYSTCEETPRTYVPPLPPSNQVFRNTRYLGAIFGRAYQP
jgi:spermidine synthase